MTGVTRERVMSVLLEMCSTWNGIFFSEAKLCEYLSLVSSNLSKAWPKIKERREIQRVLLERGTRCRLFR
jgi:hypothetical protein